MPKRTGISSMMLDIVTVSSMVQMTIAPRVGEHQTVSRVTLT
jgi:hypothetical protein